MKEYFNDTYKIYLYSICVLIILLFPMPYYISNGGGITDLSEKFEVENAYKSKGSFNLSYVSQMDANVSSYIMSYIMPNWEREKADSYKYVPTESIEDINNRGRLSLSNANQISTYVAYTKAGKEFKINEEQLYIYMVNNTNIKKIKVGDKLVSVNDIKVSDLSVLKDEIEKSDEVTIKVLRNDTEIEETIKVLDIEGTKMIGLTFQRILDYETNPKIDFSFELNESGSSAGLMTTLAIFNALTKYDYTRGLKVAGTGTIDLNGNIGEIGGVNYKILGATYGKADIFFVPSGDNYKEAVKLKKENNYDIEIVEVKTFDDAIEYLKNYKK